MAKIKQKINDEIVAQYLIDNPDFFIRNAKISEQFQVPHAVRGAVSLVEWQLARQRLRINQLEEEMTILFEQASLNQVLFHQLLNLILDLTAADSFQQQLSRLKNWTKKLGLTDVVVRLFSDRWQIDSPSEFTYLSLKREEFEPIRIQRFTQAKHYLGQLNATELNALLLEKTMVGSVALSLLNSPIEHTEQKANNSNIADKSSASGVILFISSNSHHYQAGMDTYLLEQLTELLPRLFLRWIKPL